MSINVNKDRLPYINELHYDNVGTDVNERIEVAVNGLDTGVYFLSVFNNAVNGLVYASNDPSVATISAPDGNGIKYIVFTINGLGDGPFLSIYLTDSSNTALERLSFEGVISGFDETEIGVFEDGNGPSNFSLQRRVGETTWDPPRQNTFGSANVGAGVSVSVFPSNVFSLEEKFISKICRLNPTFTFLLF